MDALTNVYHEYYTTCNNDKYHYGNHVAVLLLAQFQIATKYANMVSKSITFTNLVVDNS
jgi:hypothetical protein